DDHNPGEFGFDEWLSATNFFERDPLLSRKGKFEEFKGDSSEIVVDEALKFIRKNRESGKPLLSVIWYGSPHAPYIASAADRAAFASLDESSQHHYGELVAMDRSIGTLRKALREMNLAGNTLVWFCSDNGGLPNITPETVGGLRGFKNTVYEDGLRVPAIIEWPDVIKTPRVTRYPAGTIDIFPTIAEITRMPDSAMLKPIDGTSLKPLFTTDLKERAKPLPFRHQGRAALVDNRYKIVSQNLAGGTFELYDLETDLKESQDISSKQPDVNRRMQQALLAWNESVKASVAGKDYPEGKVDASEPPTRTWIGSPEYEKHLPQLRDRPEYSAAIKKSPAKAKRAPKAP
ncbi:MAG: sulfatase family protein, partial [Opitutaceae bacterium]